MSLYNHLKSTLNHLQHKRSWVSRQGWIRDRPSGGYEFDAEKIKLLDEQIIETQAALSGIAEMKLRKRNGERFYVFMMSFGSYATWYRPEIKSSTQASGCHPSSDHPRYL